jgi:drug/metabolite transporter (DMT)-like permease
VESGVRGVGYIVATGLLFGFVIVGGQNFLNQGLSLYEAGTFAWLFTPVILAPIIFSIPKCRIRLSDLPFFAAYGLVGVFLSLGQWAGLIFLVPVAVVSFLLYMQPVWTVLIARILLRESLTRRKILAVVIATLGILVLVDSSKFQLHSALGLLFPLLSGVALSASYTMGRFGARKGIHPFTMTFGFRGFQVAWALLLYPLIATIVSDPTFTNLRFDIPLGVWGQLFLYSLAIGVGTGFLLFKGLQTVPASTAGVILLLEPVTGTLLAALLFMQPLTLNIGAGGLLILLANYIVIAERTSVSP